MKAKELLLQELHDAFSGDDEMSLQASLGDLMPEEATWRLNDKTWTIAEIVYHIASCEIEYCRQGFGQGIEYDKSLDDVPRLLALLDRAHELLVRCLQECSKEDLDQGCSVLRLCHCEAYFAEAIPTLQAGDCFVRFAFSQ